MLITFYLCGEATNTHVLHIHQKYHQPKVTPHPLKVPAKEHFWPKCLTQPKDTNSNIRHTLCSMCISDKNKLSIDFLT